MTGWTKASVEERLIEAQRVINSTVGLASIQGRSGDIPAPVNYFGEQHIAEWVRDRWEWLKHEGYVSQDGTTILRAIPWKWPLEMAQPQAAIDRATEAMSWPVAHIPDDGRRIAVLCWMVQRAHRGRKHGFTEMVNARRKVLLLDHIEKWQAHRDKGYGLDQIARALNAASVPLAETRRAA